VQESFIASTRQLRSWEDVFLSVDGSRAATALITTRNQDDAGAYFEDNVVTRVVSTRAGAKVYYVSRMNGQAVERVMEPEIIS